MTLFEGILFAICAACIIGPVLWCMLTPPRRSDYRAPSPLEGDRLSREERVVRAYQRFFGIG